MMGFVKCFLTGNLIKSEREVLREGMFKNKNIIFLIIMPLTEIYSHVYCFKFVP